MNQKLCDFCGEIIKQKIYYLTVTEMPLADETSNNLASFLTIDEMFQVIKQRQNEINAKTRAFEIDENCKKILDYLLTLRKEQLNELKNQVEGIFKLPYIKEDKEKNQ
jgi:hypothetical protein